MQPLPKLKKTVQALCNEYARRRDCFGELGTACISCGLWTPFEKLDGGHYRPQTHSFTRYNELNVHSQCTRCNRFLHGNLSGYFRGLERKIGREKLDELDAMPREKIWTREELEELKVYYRDKLNRIKRGVDPREGDTRLSVSDLFEDI